MYRIGCLLLLALLVGCSRTTKITMLAPGPSSLSPRTTTVEAVAFSPDGKSLLVGYKVYGGEPQPAGKDKFLALWDIESGKEVREFKGHTERVLYVAFFPDGKRALTASTTHSLKVWDVETGSEKQTLGKFEGASAIITLSADGKHVVSTNGTSIGLWDAHSGKQIRRFEESDGMIESLCFSPDGTMLISGTKLEHQPSVRLKVWDVATGKLIAVPELANISGWPHGFSTDGKFLLTQRQEQPNGQVNLVLWEFATGKEFRTIDRYKIAVTARFTTDGNHLFCAVGGDMLSLLEVATGKEVWYELFPVQRLAISPDGKVAVTSTQRVGHPGRHPHAGVRLDLWEVRTGKHLKTLTLPNP